MKAWLVWTGHYSDAKVVGVYSTSELANAAAKLYEDGHADDFGYDVDGDAAKVRAGMSRWAMFVNVDDGNARWPPERIGPATGDNVAVRHDTSSPPASLRIECDARDADTVIKIAGDERAKFLALSGAPITESEHQPR